MCDGTCGLHAAEACDADEEYDAGVGVASAVCCAGGVQPVVPVKAAALTAAARRRSVSLMDATLFRETTGPSRITGGARVAPRRLR